MENFQAENQQNNFSQPAMPKQKKRIPSWLGFVIISVFTIVVFGGVFGYQYFTLRNQAENKAQDKQNTRTYQNNQDSSHNSEHIYSKTTIFSVKDEYSNFDKSIIWPVARNINNKSVLDKINKILNFETVTGDKLANVKINTRGITGADYKINYDKNNILSISISVDFVGAYPSGSTNNYSINLMSGEIIKPFDIFYKNKISDLLNVLNGKLQDNINEKLEYAKKENLLGEGSQCSEQDINDALQAWKESDPNYGKFTEENIINYKITSRGIEFIYDFGFAHVIQACQPDGIVVLSYNQLKDYISLNGLLGSEIK